MNSPLNRKTLAQPRQPLQTLAAVVFRLSATNKNFLIKYLLVVFIISFCSNVSAQFTVTIKLDAVPYKYKKDAVYIAGSFNNWNPANDTYKFWGDSLTAKLPAGNHEFKFTRGSWDNVESNADGSDIGNRSIQINSDTTLTFSIAGWKEEKKHTASGNVQLLKEDFEMPLLNKKRHIWVYIPADYKKSKKRYPVLYMQDGQNIFDEYFAPFGEWGVDECLDSLIESGKPGCIVVAIETGGMDRMSEYNPYEFTWKRNNDTTTFPPKADEYLGDIIKKLKPFIDKKFRTLSSKENTIITGSSMGGLLAYYAVVKYPDVFGKAGIFSPAFWTASGIDNLTDSLANTLQGKYFFYMGGKEGEDDLKRMIKIKDKVGANSSAMVYSVIDPEGKHNEAAWRKWFAEFYNFIIADGYNVINNGEN